MDHAGPMTIRICHLYPSLLSVAGDRGNLLALTRRCAWRGIGTSVAEADVGVTPDFSQFDLSGAPLLRAARAVTKIYRPRS